VLEDVVIIGGGPAGLATAMQLKRHGVDALLLERTRLGGLLLNANLVENYPGFASGISGPELASRFVDHAHAASLRVRFEEVCALSYDGEAFEVKTDATLLRAKVAVIASGTKAKPLPDLNIPEGLADHVFYEVHPLREVRDKKIGIIGAGDAAFDYALNLAQRNQVVILNRGQAVKCLPLLWERAQATAAISYRADTSVTKLESHDAGLLVTCTGPEGVSQIEADYLLGAIGRSPQLDFLSEQFLKDSPELERKGVLYWVGDVKNDRYRQTAIAVGEGIMAGMRISYYLKGESA